MEDTTKARIGSRLRLRWAEFSTAFCALCPRAIRFRPITAHGSLATDHG